MSEYLKVIESKYDPSIHGIFEGDFEKEHFQTNFKWDDFQLHAFQAIKRGDNVLVVAPTSSGKTSIAKYAMLYNLIKNNVRVVYTTPIKSLSNEKYEEMKEVLAPYGICPGLLTGDQKINIDSKFLIMTAEILSNSLFMLRDTICDKNTFKLDKDFIKTLGCVIIDEIHFISDQDRGHVWENTLIMIDPSVQLIGLSATIDKPEDFASWIGRIKKRNITLVKKYDRPVPLEFGIYNGSEVKIIMDVNGQYYGNEFQNASRELKELEKIHEKKRTNKVHSLLNNFIKYAKEKDLLQLCFIIFSKKNCEKFAESVSINLVNQCESSLAVKELEHKMGMHLKNYQSMPNYIQIRSLIGKGVCYHHAGLPVILKEIIEYLFKTGHIKVLFATETIAVGVNMPIRTLVLSSVEKASDSGNRSLNATEFKQICGRAGRRGLDKKGMIVFLPLYEFPSENHIKTELLFGPLPKIMSRMELSYHAYIKILRSKCINQDLFFDQSLLAVQNNTIHHNILKEVKRFEEILKSLKIEIDKYISRNNIDNNTNDSILEYIKSKQMNDIGFTVKTSKYQNKLDIFIKKNKHLYDLYIKYFKNIEEKQKLDNELEYYTSYKTNRYQQIRDYLEYTGYLTESGDITEYGIMASVVNECNPFVLAEIFTSGVLQQLEPKQIIS